MKTGDLIRWKCVSYIQQRACVACDFGPPRKDLNLSPFLFQNLQVAMYTAFWCHMALKYQKIIIIIARYFCISDRYLSFCPWGEPHPHPSSLWSAWPAKTAAVRRCVRRNGTDTTWEGHGSGGSDANPYPIGVEDWVCTGWIALNEIERQFAEARSSWNWETQYFNLFQIEENNGKRF